VWSHLPPQGVGGPIRSGQAVYRQVMDLCNAPPVYEVVRFSLPRAGRPSLM
jgi:hypothetical protein